MRLIEEISKHYYTEESSRYLAVALLKNDDIRFVENEISEMYPVDWSNVAQNVMKEWAIWTTPNSITLLRAIQKTNEKAARIFQQALSRGEFRSS